MEDVRLLPIGPELAGALRAGSEPLRQRYGALVAAEDLPIVRDVVEQTLLMPDYDDAGGWGGYLAVDRTSDLIVGSCAFKGPPTEDGTVEIAYYTFGPYAGQGRAKSMARALTHHHGAFVAPRAPRDRAHAARGQPVDLRLAERGDGARRRGARSGGRPGLALAARIRGGV
jgi:hypothetical protein